MSDMGQEPEKQSLGPPAETAGGAGNLDALRDRFWERASLEGLGLDAFLKEEVLGLEGSPAGEREAGFACLRELVEDVADTRLLNIALKAEDEGTIYAELADERIEEVQEERTRLIDWLETEAGPGRDARPE